MVSYSVLMMAVNTVMYIQDYKTKDVITILIALTVFFCMVFRKELFEDNHWHFELHPDQPPVIIKKPNNIQIMILAGAAIAFIVGIVACMKAESKLKAEAANESIRRNNYLIYNRWMKVKRIVQTFGLLPLRLNKDTEQIALLVKYLVESYRSASTLNSIWDDAMSIFTDEYPGNERRAKTYENDDLAEKIISRLTPVLETKINHSVEAAIIDLEEKFVPQMEAARSESPSDEDSTDDEEEREYAIPVIHSPPEDLPGSRLFDQPSTQRHSERNYIDMTTNENIADLLQRKSQTNRYGLGYIGPAHERLQRSFKRFSCWITSGFTYIFSGFTLLWRKWQTYRRLKRTIYIGSAIAAAGAVSYISYQQYKKRCSSISIGCDEKPHGYVQPLDCVSDASKIYDDEGRLLVTQNVPEKPIDYKQPPGCIFKDYKIYTKDGKLRVRQPKPTEKKTEGIKELISTMKDLIKSKEKQEIPVDNTAGLTATPLTISEACNTNISLIAEVKQTKSERFRKKMRATLRQQGKSLGGQVPREVYDDAKQMRDRAIEEDPNHRADYEQIFRDEIDDFKIGDFADKADEDDEEKFDDDPFDEDHRRGYAGRRARAMDIQPAYRITQSSESKNTESKNNPSSNKSSRRLPKEQWVALLKQRREARKQVQQDIVNELYRAEHLMSGSSIVTQPILYCVEFTDKFGKKGYVNALPVCNALVIPRHGIAGAKSGKIQIGYEWLDFEVTLGAPVHIMPDQIVIKKPPIAKIRMNSSKVYREPVKGETAVLFFRLKDGEMRIVSGTIGLPRTITTGGATLTLMEWEGSSVEGACGGVYIGKDGAIIGVHGLGSASNPTSKPLFYPIPSDWPKYVLAALNIENKTKIADDDQYSVNFNRFMNRDNSLTVETIKSLEFPPHCHELDLKAKPHQN